MQDEKSVLLTAAQMRALEQAAIDSGRVTGLELMERAGRGVVDAVLEEWPHFATTPHRAVVLCGPGNNGGDGFVVARLLKERGWDVDVFLYGEVGALPPDAKVNAERWLEMGDISAWSDSSIEDEIDEIEEGLVIDALFGIGLSRTMPNDTASTWRGIMGKSFLGSGGAVVAIDMPSGICSDSGTNLEGAFIATLTVTFGRKKLGHVLCGGGKLSGGATWCGTLRVVDIGLHSLFSGASAPDRARPAPQGGRDAPPLGPGAILDASYRSVRLIEGVSPAVIARTGAHKYAHGHALVLAGGVGRGGAARLAGRGALRIGAGLVTVAPPPSALIENAAQLNAIMLQPVRDADALAGVLQDDRINALCLGPGLGVERAAELVLTALAATRATVLDADALTAFADSPARFFVMLHPRCVLTPHAGEFARLFPDLAERLDAVPTSGPAYSKVDATREAAARAGCTVLYKGPDSVIADPDGRCSINASVYERSAPWLATAGSGDVLAGFITGLLARGLTPHNAAATAAFLHTECALAFGPGLIAEDLPEQLPRVLARLTANSP
ncbi:NAD(P)H-hydrate dehydratase [Roseobacter sp. HKCCA0434]|uniref:NAD(P)H-hydrate dehydratase n=1 Tax=Roseobacter sp. HKCCA0434 TaxID=3079297 RepID=UPI002905BE8C|nr:NAD(P)H-hydrate dehydratase [Roseobacter sp. HKCCA0434]